MCTAAKRWFRDSKSWPASQCTLRCTHQAIRKDNHLLILEIDWVIRTFERPNNHLDIIWRCFTEKCSAISSVGRAGSSFSTFKVSLGYFCSVELLNFLILGILLEPYWESCEWQAILKHFSRLISIASSDWCWIKLLIRARHPYDGVVSDDSNDRASLLSEQIMSNCRIGHSFELLTQKLASKSLGQTVRTFWFEPSECEE